MNRFGGIMTLVVATMTAGCFPIQRGRAWQEPGFQPAAAATIVMCTIPDGGGEMASLQARGHS